MSVRHRTRFLRKKVIGRVKGVIGVGLICLFVWGSQTEEFYHATKQAKGYLASKTADMGFVLENVYISGQKHVTSEDILSSIKAVDGIPILAISLDESKAILEEMGWISDVKIERQLPSTLHIIITEREPFAIWQYMGSVSLIDIDGNMIVEGGTSGYNDLPIIVGEDANLNAKHLFSFLSTDSDIFSKVSSIIRVGGRRWNVRLNNGIEIKLPEVNPDHAWKQLIELHTEKRLLDRNIKLVDMRVSGKLFVEPKK